MFPSKHLHLVDVPIHLVGIYLANVAIHAPGKYTAQVPGRCCHLPYMHLVDITYTYLVDVPINVSGIISIHVQKSARYVDVPIHAPGR
jgi:hypothetical protein